MRLSERVVLARKAVTASRFACGPRIFPRNDPRGFLVQDRLRQQLLELAVLGFQFPQPLGAWHIHATELAVPQVERGIAALFRAIDHFIENAVRSALERSRRNK